MPVKGPFHEIVKVLSEDRLLLRDRLKFFNSLGDLPSQYQVWDHKYVAGSLTPYQLFHDVLEHIFSINGTLTFRQLKEKLTNNGFRKAAELLEGINDVDDSSEMSDVSNCGTLPFHSGPKPTRIRQKKPKPTSFNEVEGELLDRSSHGQRTCPSLHWPSWIIILLLGVLLGVGMGKLLLDNFLTCGDASQVEVMEIRRNKELRDLNEICADKLEAQSDCMHDLEELKGTWEIQSARVGSLEALKSKCEKTLETQSDRIDGVEELKGSCEESLSHQNSLVASLQKMQETCEETLNIQSARVGSLESLKSKCEGTLKSQSDRTDGLEKQLSKNEQELSDVRRKYDYQLATAKLLEGREQERKESEKKICKCNDKLMDNLRDQVNQCNMEKTFVANDLQELRRYTVVYFGAGFFMFPLVLFCIAVGLNVANGRPMLT